MTMSDSQVPHGDFEPIYEPGKHPDLDPPAGTTGVVGWLRENLFSSPLNGLATLATIAILYILIVPIVNWVALDAVSSGTDRRLCDVGRAAGAIGTNYAAFNAEDFQIDGTREDLPRSEARALRDSSKAVERAQGFVVEFDRKLALLANDDLVPASLATALAGLDVPAIGAEISAAIQVRNIAGIQQGFATLQPLMSWGNGHDGACWTVIKQRSLLFLIGFYERDQAWRLLLAAIGLIVAVAPLLFDKLPFRRRLLFFSFAFPLIAYWLLAGGFLGMSEQPTDNWGGLLVTVISGVVGITASLPIGIVLALGRRSKMPVVRMLCVCFIEAVRGVPLITILFMSSVMLPLFLPEGVNFDKFLRALIGVALFASAYMAEVVRGGLQAIPKGQYEAAEAMGLTYWKSMRLIVLPQALKIVIPGIVNTFIGLFKDTSLLGIIGILDLLQVAKSTNADANWIGFFSETYTFVGFLFFIFCFSMSRYSIYLEKKLHTGHKR